MEIVWDEQKNWWLKDTRNVSFEQIAGVIFAEQYLDIAGNPTRANQEYFVIWLREYTWLVRFLVDDSGRIVLKTAYPSRKAHRRYGGKQ
ncbi:MAG: BrnT family toxin [Spirochaetales bacterium]|nr:BrnT family toxin [Spirochaetales bacterium]